MVARVEGGGDGRPTPTIIEINLVRNKISRLQSSRPSSGALQCIPHVIMMLHNNHYSVLNIGSLKYDRTFQMHAAPPRHPGHLQERGQDVQNLQQRRALQVGAV